MSMYYGVLLTPIEPEVVPATIKVLQLLDWLIEKGDILLPTPADPIRVEWWSEEYNDFDEVEFIALDENLETYLNDKSEWILSGGTKKYQNDTIPKGSISACLEFTGSEVGWSSSVWRIETYCLDVNSFFGFDKYDAALPRKKFALKLMSDMKASHPLERAEEYFDFVWPRLVDSGMLSQLEQILGMKLESEPYFG